MGFYFRQITEGLRTCLGVGEVSCHAELQKIEAVQPKIQILNWYLSLNYPFLNEGATYMAGALAKAAKQRPGSVAKHSKLGKGTTPLAIGAVRNWWTHFIGPFICAGTHHFGLARCFWSLAHLRRSAEC